VRHIHELGEHWSTKDGVLSTLKVRDHEVNVVSAEVVWIAELHRERDLPERYANIFPRGSIIEHFHLPLHPPELLLPVLCLHVLQE
jgi:hypothetical protein